MIQYLEYLKRIFFTTGTKYIGIILSELTLYQKVYLKYGNLKQNNPVYPKDKKLPVIHLHSDEIISALVDLNSFLNYIIVRNIKVFYDCVFGGKSMRPLLQFSDFGVYI